MTDSRKASPKPRKAAPGKGGTGGQGGQGGDGGDGGEPGGIGGSGGPGGEGGSVLPPRRLWERVAPWLAGAGAIVMLAVPVGGYFVIHDTQVDNARTLTNTKNSVSAILKAFGCQEKALNGLLQDVPLAFLGDKNPADYARIAKMCKVAQAPAGK